MDMVRRIERYIRRNGIAPSQFGRRAVNDPRLLSDLRRGRELRPAMVARLAAYLDSVGAGR